MASRAGALTGYWRAYSEFWRLNFLTMIEYKANFVIWLVFNFVYHGVAIGAIWVTMTRFPSMNGWTYQEVFFLYTLFMLGHTLNNTLFFTVGNVPEYVRDGTFDAVGGLVHHARVRLADLGASDSDRARPHLLKCESWNLVRFRMRAVTHASRPAHFHYAPDIPGHNVYINKRRGSA